ncbi:hypothetical protein NDU88_002691 [Pleurodeles waltl]|uniref:Uncharacterized protein n=1 Tax=Pleurodeles waltl TaxID=8319 RepID=A0AAV7Q7Q6_PLEWA|nr:hypothetical protein NDU88_002691 [Pleurodeles waltl]
MEYAAKPREMPASAAEETTAAKVKRRNTAESGHFGQDTFKENNIWIIGLQEKIEGTSREIVDFLETWLQECLSQYYALERAHRVPALQALPGAALRPVVAKLLYYRD